MKTIEQAIKDGDTHYPGNVYFRGSKITNLGNLQSIRGGAYFAKYSESLLLLMDFKCEGIVFEFLK